MITESISGPSTTAVSRAFFSNYGLSFMFTYPHGPCEWFSRNKGLLHVPVFISLLPNYFEMVTHPPPQPTPLRLLSFLLCVQRSWDQVSRDQWYLQENVSQASGLGMEHLPCSDRSGKSCSHPAHTRTCMLTALMHRPRPFVTCVPFMVSF